MSQPSSQRVAAQYQKLGGLERSATSASRVLSWLRRYRAADGFKVDAVLGLDGQPLSGLNPGDQFLEWTYSKKFQRHPIFSDAGGEVTEPYTFLWEIGANGLPDPSKDGLGNGPGHVKSVGSLKYQKSGAAPQPVKLAQGKEAGWTSGVFDENDYRKVKAPILAACVEGQAELQRMLAETEKYLGVYGPAGMEYREEYTAAKASQRYMREMYGKIQDVQEAFRKMVPR